MMLISMIQDLDACTSDAGFFRVAPTNQRTNEQGDSRSWITKMILGGDDRTDVGRHGDRSNPPPRTEGRQEKACWQNLSLQESSKS